MGRWTDLAHRQESTKLQGGKMVEHRGLVVHIAEGTYPGTITWEQNVKDNKDKSSSHFIVDRDGTICQMIDTDTTAYTQRAGNGHWLSVECAGFTTGNPLHKTHAGWEKLTDQQVNAVARLLLKTHQVYGVPLQIATSPTGKGLGHHCMGGTAWGHLDCPGSPIIAQKPLIVARAKQLTEPATPATEQEDDVLTLVQRKGKAAVYVSNGITHRWVRTEAELKQLQNWGLNHWKNLANSGKVVVVGNDDDFRALAGELVGPDPETPQPAAVAATTGQ